MLKQVALVGLSAVLSISSGVGQEAVQKPEKKVIEVQGRPIPPVAGKAKLPAGKVVEGVRIEPITVNGVKPLKGSPIPAVPGKGNQPVAGKFVEGIQIPAPGKNVK